MCRTTHRKGLARMVLCCCCCCCCWDSYCCLQIDYPRMKGILTQERGKTCVRGRGLSYAYAGEVVLWVEVVVFVVAVCILV